MNYSDIAENVVAALLSALAITAIVWAISWTRNILLERKLKDAINPNGVGIDYDASKNRGTFSLQIHNYANAAIRVRAVVLKTDKFHVELRPAEGKPIYQTPLSNEIVRHKFKRKHLSKGVLEPDGNPNSMLLPPKTMGVWEVKSETITSREWIVESVYVVFEYATIFGNSALVRVKAKESTLRLVKQNFEPLWRAIHRKEPSDVCHGLREAPQKVYKALQPTRFARG